MYRDKVVVVNQAVNYLTIGICNEFRNKVENVALITGNIHAQGEELNSTIVVKYINKWKEEHGIRKVLNNIRALISIYLLLLIKYNKYEVFFVSAPPMAYLLNIFLPNQFSMLIWDVYPDSLKITGMKESHFIYRFWSFLNKKSFKKAYKVFTIGNKMAELLSSYIGKEKLIIQPIWSIFQENRKIGKENNPFVKEYQLEGKFVVQYSGNIGLTHNVEVMIDLAERFKNNNRILFQIIVEDPGKSICKNWLNRKN